MRPWAGVIEGYYGRPWSGAARRDVIRFLATHGLDTFVYAPKNDPWHRDRWREPYPSGPLADLAASAAAAGAAGVRFVWALSPAVDFGYGEDTDFAALAAKLTQVAGAGVHRFALLFDDAPERLDRPGDVARYGGNDGTALARAHADLTNRTHAWLATQRLGTLEFIVPTHYAGNDPTPYHAALGAALVPALPIGWTGSGVFAAFVTGTEARARRACLEGHPVVLWDNVPVNDTVLANNLHLGPLTGRSRDLPAELAGYLMNPMPQAYASLVAIGTAAAWLRDPSHYDPETAWYATLNELGGPGLAILAENVRSSVLDLDDARPLAAALAALRAHWDGPVWEPALDAVAAEEARQARAPALIAAELGPHPLAAEIAPWVTELARHAARGAEAVALLRALRPALVDLEVDTRGGVLRVTGRALPADTATAERFGPGFAAEADATAARIAAPDLPGLLAALGPLLGADIRLPVDLGLNVHGKALCAIARTATDLQIVSDRNVHDQLVLFTGAAYRAWQARRGAGADALAVTLDERAVPMDPGGRFAATTPLGDGRRRLAVTTAAGEVTARLLP